jgi:hypothetical protein
MDRIKDKTEKLERMYSDDKHFDIFLLLSILTDLNKEVQELKQLLAEHIANKKMHEC